MVNLERLRKELNSEQLIAAQTTQGPVLILAGAGSGKTKTITFRMAYMMDSLNIPGDSILGITFTNKAAQEMRTRVRKLIKGENNLPTLCTFHSLGVTILREDIHHIGRSRNFTIYDTSDQIALIREALHNFRANKSLDRKIILSKISWLKNNRISPQEFISSSNYDESDPYDDATHYAYVYYQDKLRFFNAIDFDDILGLTLDVLENNPQLKQKYSERFRYIMVDEYQDTNELQFKLIQYLTTAHKNLCVVGDDDQAIYAFRGADVEKILQFEKHYPGAKVVKLEQNYRSTQAILNLANNIIAMNPKRKEKKLWSHKNSNSLPYLWATQDTDHEAQIVIDDILKYQQNGNSLKDISILFRSNTQCTPFEDQLRLSQIPYKIIGGQKFYDKKEVKDLIAYLSVIQNPNDTISLRRILNVPARGIGTTTLENYLKIADERKTSLFSVFEKNSTSDKSRSTIAIASFVNLIHTARVNFKSMSLSEAIASLVKLIDYDGHIEKSYLQINQVVRRKNDILQFIESARRFENYCPTPKLHLFLEKVLLQDSQDNEAEPTDGNEVTLMTLHSSKGLEFKRVYLVGMEEELLPHKKTTSLNQDISEELRLTYVGVTRAQEELIMTYAKKRNIYGKDHDRFPSRFVANLSDSLLTRQDRTCFGHMNEQEIKEYKKNFFEQLISTLD